MPKTDTSVDSEQALDDRLLGQLEENCEKLNKVIDIAYHLFKNPINIDRSDAPSGRYVD
jgi:hypothetical protein